MKLMMKKWLVRPMALLLLAMLMVTEPASVLANENDPQEVAETVMTESVEEASVETEGNMEEIAEEVPVVADTEPAETETPEESPSEPQPQKSYTMVVDETVVWTGSKVKPEHISLVNDTTGECIELDPDSCEVNSQNVGPATITTIYQGITYTADFNIVPPKANNVAFTNGKSNAFDVSCASAPSGMTKSGKISYTWKLLKYNSKKGKFVIIRTANTTKNTVKFENLSSATVYKVKVRYVVTDSDKNETEYAGSYSYLAAKKTSPKKVSLTAADKTGGKSMLVKWKAVSGADSYQIQYSKTSNFSKKYNVTVKDGSAVSKKVTDMKTNVCVYVRVRAISKYKGKNILGEWSTAKLTHPEKAGTPKFVSRSDESFTVKCDKAKTAGVAYQFQALKYNQETKKWEVTKTIRSDENKATFKGLSAGLKYKVKVRFTKKISSGYSNGAWSYLKTVATKPAKTIISGAYKSSGKKVKVTWTSVSHGTGYEVQCATSSDFKNNAKSVFVKGAAKNSKIVEVDTSSEYYARVRAYVEVNGKKIYGPWSDTRYTSFAHVYSSYTTTYSTSNYNRSTNLRLACQALNGTIIQPGQQFSFNGIVGERTAAKGYKEAIIYEGGQEVGGIGGGICQVATTIFNAVLKANFTINERHQHSMTVHYAPLGYDAAIAWGSKNLRFTNTAGVPIKVYASASGGVLTIKFLTSADVNPPKVTTSCSVSNRVYTLKRYVNGKCNYTTTSKYLDV